ncbi:sensor histidine kinase [Actinokineospora inagensis]|uniref:sensor histidine kinase n=1 Tax=Actinokineospora inagensis TaxID=103730 RepID=UPI000421EA2E|nr:nitrate- and nitrite sensing domain-containing protein [Actinokineospora inagensis]
MTTLTRWRDWNIPVKLAAVILVPVVFAVVLGVLRISGQVERAQSYQRVDKLVAVNESLRKTLTWLQRERTKAAVLLTSGSRDVAAELAGERQSADYAREEMYRAIGKATFDTEVTRARLRDVTSAFDTLTALRRPVGAGSVDSGTALEGYTDVIHALLNFDRATTGEVADPGLANTAAALHDLEAAKEEIYFQQGMVAIGIARGGLNAADLDSLRASQSRLAERTSDFRSIATLNQQAGYDELHNDPSVRARTDLLRLAVGDGSDGSAAVNVPLPITSADWNTASEQASQRISAVSALLGTEIKERSSALQDEAGNAAGLASVVLLLALVAAAGVMLVIGRQLLGSLALLRRGALDVASNRLPAAVARIRDGRDVAEPVVEPVAVLPDDEVGEVARAFDAVHQQALRLATEQAGLRANYSNVFVNLSRRSQSLVQRQLHLLERLERDEEDADQLATLFQLDHLATRMRRNNENLMVLSGADSARRAQQPTELGDLLRAAVSEIEQYPRVVISPPAAVLVVGYAAGDLVRLVAELLDNATAFSAPATQVTVASHRTDAGALKVEVVDRGIGMSESELAEVNERLADSGTIDASTSRRMGLFVVGRLAARLNVEVRLRPATQPGIRAVVTIPAELVVGEVVPDVPRITVTAHPPRPTANGHTNGANGSNGSHGYNGHANGHNGFSAGLARRLANGKPKWDPTRPPGGDGAELPLRTPVGDGLPLPRRASRPAAEPEPTEALVTNDPAPDGDPAATDDGGWWDTTLVHQAALVDEPAQAPPPAALHETTPIFDEMVSAWFRAVTDDPNSTAADADRGPGWDFAADQGFHTAREVLAAEPDDFTTSGLPRRTPRRNLVPGGVQNGASATGGGQDDGTRGGKRSADPLSGRDANHLRKRLSSYQRGIHRARGAHHAGPAHATPDELTAELGRHGRATPPADAQPTDALPSKVQPGNVQPGDEGSGHRLPDRQVPVDGVPATTAPADALPGDGGAVDPPHGYRVSSAAMPPAAAMSGGRESGGGGSGDRSRGYRVRVDELSDEPLPVDVLPGDRVPVDPPVNGPPARRSPVERGVTRGGPTDTGGALPRRAVRAGALPEARRVESGPATGVRIAGLDKRVPGVAARAVGMDLSDPGPGGVTAPLRLPAEPESPVRQADPNGLLSSPESDMDPVDTVDTGHTPGHTPGLDLRGAPWRFAPDAGWQAAEALATTAADQPEGLLPRRTPRERLLPGSLDPATARQVPVERDAEALRSRLGSLQRGIGRGRSSIARRPGTPTEGDTEKEGRDA